MAEEILYVQPRHVARQKRAQTVQHVFGAGLLMFSGYESLQHNPVLAIVEIAAGAMLVIAIIVEKTRHHHSGRVAFVEVAGAVMMLVDAIEKTRGHHHLLFKILWFFTPIPYILFAFFDAQIGMRRYIKVDDRGVELRLRLLFWRRVHWDDIRGYRVRGDQVDFGGGSINLQRIIDRDRAKDWLIDVLRRRGIAELPA